jgi:DNA-binding transcriptional LysR family regulator
VARAPRNAQRSAPPAHQRTGALDWGDLRFFLELARTGSLSAAARRLGVDRNTVARRVAALEQGLAMVLFDRGPQGWSPSPAGRELEALAGQVESDVLALARHADARDRAVSGTVRLTTPSHLASHLFVPALGALRQRHPGLLLELAADQRNFDLSRREADLAVRMGRPRDSGLVTRKLSEVAYGLYASAGYREGRRGPVDLAEDHFLTFDDSLSGTPQERWLARTAPGCRVAFRCNSTFALMSAARQGLGVAMLPCFLAAQEPALRRLDGPEPPPHEMWMLVHGDLRRAPRVRAVLEWIDAVVAEARPALCGKADPGGQR